MTFPPREPCEKVWGKLVEWLSVKMQEDAPRYQDPGPVPIFNLTFRGLEFTHCPFCGKEFNPLLPIGMRHES